MWQSGHQCLDKATVISLTTGYVAVSLRQLYRNEPAEYAERERDKPVLSWEQYDNYSLAVTYYEQLPTHLSNTQVVEKQLQTSRSYFYLRHICRQTDGKRARRQYLYKCTAPTTWQVSPQYDTYLSCEYGVKIQLTITE